MRRGKLGARGPEISVIGYGAWEAGGTAWGPNESEDVVIEAIRVGIESGADWIDTAEVYGDGVSELLVGRAISGRRDEVVVAT
jgi:aryl-alcohol dehydrogenase-like predicted oxidoreductase